jgi:probable FeS assembly SUF system protein SufT
VVSRAPDLTEDDERLAAALADHEVVALTRDVDAVEVPTGFWITLRAATLVRVVSTLGDDFTVVVDDQYMARIPAADADALGREAPAPTAAADRVGLDAPLEERVWAQLHTVYDPEIPIDIVELGLVYDCRLEPLPDDRTRVVIDLTLTAPGCGMGDVLCADVRRKVGALPGVAEVAVELVLDPPWDASRMSEAARLQLGLL